MSAYFAEKMINKYITKYSSNQRLFFFFQCVHADQVGQHFNLRPNFQL